MLTCKNIVDLPGELLYDISEYLPHDAVKACTETCSSWHDIFPERLYTAPHLRDTDSYVSFVDTILNRPELGTYVRVLDLSRVVGTLKTIKLSDLMRACPNLQEFYAPQAAFTPHMMQVLPSLTQLRVLDLECCIERFEISRVINYCSELTHLHTFKYPRCAVSTIYPIKQYPRALRHFALRGGLRDDFITKMASANHPTLPVESLLISYAPSITAPPMLELISTLPKLRELSVAWPIMRFGHNSFDSLLHLAPQLQHLAISVDYISPRFFEHPHAKLQSLTLNFSGVGKHRILAADDVVDAIVDEQHFPALERLGISRKLSELLFRDSESSDLLRSATDHRAITLYMAEDVDHDMATIM